MMIKIDDDDNDDARLGSSLGLSVDSAKLWSVDCCFFAKPANVNLDVF